MTFHINTKIKSGSHRLPSEGSCAMEIACLAAGFAWTEVRSAADLPECMSRVIGAYVIRLNDAMPDDKRQRLMAFVPRLTVTRGTDAEEKARAEYLVMHAAKPAVVAALRSAGLQNYADEVSAAQTVPAIKSAASHVAAAAGVTALARRRVLQGVAAAAAAAAGDAHVAAAAAGRAVAVAVLAGGAEAHFDWTPYLDALDGALRIGPQAEEIDIALIKERTRVLVNA